MNQAGAPRFSEAVRPVFFQTNHEEFLYATHGGTLFVVRFRGRIYALTCRHVFQDFKFGDLFIPGEKHAKQGCPPAPIKGIYYPSSPRDGAIGTDVEDLCVIEFENGLAADFFGGSEYVADESTVTSSQNGDELEVAGVLKDKTRIDPPDIEIGYCRLEFRDTGASSDPFMRQAMAIFWKPEFARITGISGSPVFNLTRNALCGMVVRGGMTGSRCNIQYLEITDIVRVLTTVSEGATSTYYKKHVAHGIRQ